MAESFHNETRVALRLEELQRWQRLRGLIGRPAPAPGNGVLLRDCRSVHGFLMSYAIDVVFVDREFRVLRVATLPPWRAVTCMHARHTIELREGEADRLGIRVGTPLEKYFEKGG